MSGTPHEADPLIGHVIDSRYRVTERLGEGGMGFVYLATHEQLGHTLVIKRLRPELVDSGSTSERFTREAQAASRIQHPHVIGVTDFGVLPDFGAYYVMERLEGADLGAELAATGAMSLERAVGIIEQAAEALAAAHAVSIVHRDLKPENVFLTTRDGQPDFVKVLDFGLARVMDANRKLTETGQVIGTPRYMAPEQCRGEKVDARADVYSLGLILYEMLTGHQPYRGLSTYEILGKKMFEHIEPPGQLSPPVVLPPPLEAFLMRCLEREAPLRPSHGAMMADELHAVRIALGLPPNPYANLAEGARQSLPQIFEPPVSSVASAEPPLLASSPSTAPPMAAPSAPPPRADAPSSRLPLLLGIGAGGLLVMALASATAAWFLFARTDVPPAAVTAPEPSVPAAAEPAPTPPPAQSEVRVETEPPGAELVYQGVLVGTTPLSVAVPGAIPSGSSVELRLDGYQTREIALISGVPMAHIELHPVNGAE
ncbi:MAG: serine/threonine-protein kinase [Sandaracinaceae bacterium]